MYIYLFIYIIMFIYLSFIFFLIALIRAIKIINSADVSKVVILTKMEDVRRLLPKLEEMVGRGFRSAKGGKGRKNPNSELWFEFYLLYGKENLSIEWNWDADSHPMYAQCLEIAQAQSISD